MKTHFKTRFFLGAFFFVVGILNTQYLKATEVVTCLSDSPWDGKTIDKVNDGSTFTAWLSWLSPTWIKYSYSTPTVWKSYNITSFNSRAYDPKNWRIEASNNDSSWVVLATVDGAAWSNNYERKSFNLPNTSAYKYYKWVVTQNSGNTTYGTQAAEFSFSSQSSDSIIIVVTPVDSITVTAKSDSPWDGKTISKINDGNPATAWWSWDSPTWVQFSYLSPTVWSTYSITSSDNRQYDPKDWKVEASNDGNNWTLLNTTSGSSWGNSYEKHSFRLDNSTPYFYYRWTVTQNSGNTMYGTQVAEFSFGKQLNYLAYEGFNYAVNAPLDGQTGGAGWKNAWDVNGVGFKGGWLTSATTGSLNYLDLKGSGNYGTGGFQWYLMGRRLDTSEKGPFSAWVEPWEDGIGTKKTATTIFMSALLGKNNSNNDEAYFDLHENELSWYNYAPNLKRIGVGYFGTASDVNGQKHWSLRIDTTLYDTGIPVTIGTPSLFVLKFNFDPTQTTVSVYINPTTIGETLPVNPTLVSTVNTRHCIRSLGVYLGSTANNGVIDEIRLGGTYASVAPNAQTIINLPPVADYTLSTNRGAAPLQVILDASSAQDPEGLPLKYVWDFGDGSPKDSSMIVTHTYSGLLGVITPTLSVVDNMGAKNSISRGSVTITDSENTFPCQTLIQEVKMASCGQSDGSIRIYIPYTSTVVLKNSDGVTMPAGNDGFIVYNNLTPGTYDLFVDGVNGCSDYRQLTIVTDSSTCSGWTASIASMQIGTNLTSLSDWGRERPFRNLMKNVREEFVPYLPSNSAMWSTDYPVNHWTSTQMTFDSAGYPTYLPQNTSSGATGLRYVVTTEKGNLLPGQTYVLLYDGEGTIEFPGTTVVSSTPGRIEFQLSTAQTGTVFFNMSYSKAGDNVRNIRLLKLSDEFVDLNTNTFSQEFLDRIAPFKSLRFMEWTGTNGSPITDWSQRNLVNRWTYSGAGGVPFEMIIKLANETQKDVWINVPHKASDSYITQMATLFKEQLDPSLTVYLEYSNEIWNWSFSQCYWNLDNKPINLSYGRAAAEKAKHVFQIWYNVFGSDYARVKRLLGLQGGYTELSENIMAELKNDEWDLASTSFYYSLDHADVGTLANPVLSSTSTPADIITNSWNKWEREKPMMKRLYNCAKLYGKSIIGYEGGQHFVGQIGGTNYPYQEIMYDAQTCPQMYDLYSHVLEDIRNLGCSMAMNYSLAGDQRSMYGSWGALTDITMMPPFLSSAPKYQALIDNIDITQQQNRIKSNFVKKDGEISNSKTDVLIYPNPTKGDISVKVDKSETMIKMQVFDSAGNLLKETNQSTVSLSPNSEGIFVLKVYTQSGVHVEKIMKKR
ncbi:MAG: PKD domain-containing protein [Bacteroidales bacterium]|nr:PKD domain-containing protein [Bacteroidales bacterium]